MESSLKYSFLPSWDKGCVYNNTEGLLSEKAKLILITWTLQGKDIFFCPN
jgi:hypothetical protein